MRTAEACSVVEKDGENTIAVLIALKIMTRPEDIYDSTSLGNHRSQQPCRMRSCKGYS